MNYTNGLGGRRKSWDAKGIRSTVYTRLHYNITFIFNFLIAFGGGMYLSHLKEIAPKVLIGVLVIFYFKKLCM